MEDKIQVEETASAKARHQKGTEQKNPDNSNGPVSQNNEGRWEVNISNADPSIWTLFYEQMRPKAILVLLNLECKDVNIEMPTKL